MVKVWFYFKKKYNKKIKKNFLFRSLRTKKPLGKEDLKKKFSKNLLVSFCEIKSYIYNRALRRQFLNTIAKLSTFFGPIGV